MQNSFIQQIGTIVYYMLVIVLSAQASAGDETGPNPCPLGAYLLVG